MSGLLTEEEKAELNRMGDRELEERFGGGLPAFGTSGIRALTGLGIGRLNRFTYRLLARGWARMLRGRGGSPWVLVVHDNRPEGRRWSLEVASALRGEGVDVLLAPGGGGLSTPLVSRLVRSMQMDGAMEVTASHNERIYNGLKIYGPEGRQLAPEEEAEFIRCLEDPEEMLDAGMELWDEGSFPKVSEGEIWGYLAELVEQIPVGERRDVPVLFSGLGGTTEGLMERFVHRMGFVGFREHIHREVECLNPEEPEAFREMMVEAEREGINYAVCADLDGDRAALAERRADGAWRMFNGHEMGAMLAHFRMGGEVPENPYMVSTHVTGTLVNVLFPEMPIHRCDTGFKNIGAVVEREERRGNNLVMAFEEACGALMNPLHREKDAYQQVG